MSCMTWRARCAEQGAAVAALKKCQEQDKSALEPGASCQERRYRWRGGRAAQAEGADLKAAQVATLAFQRMIKPPLLSL